MQFSPGGSFSDGEWVGEVGSVEILECHAKESESLSKILDQSNGIMFSVLYYYSGRGLMNTLGMGVVLELQR